MLLPIFSSNNKTDPEVASNYAPLPPVSGKKTVQISTFHQRRIRPLRRQTGLSAPARGLPPFFRRPCASVALDRSRPVRPCSSACWTGATTPWPVLPRGCWEAAVAGARHGPTSPPDRRPGQVPRHTRSGGRSDRPEDPMAMLSCPYIPVQLLSRASRAAGGASPVPSISLVPAGNPINYLHLSSAGDAPILCSQPRLSSPSDAAPDW